MAGSREYLTLARGHEKAPIARGCRAVYWSGLFAEWARLVVDFPIVKLVIYFVESLIQWRVWVQVAHAFSNKALQYVQVGSVFKVLHSPALFHAVLPDSGHVLQVSLFVHGQAIQGFP